MARKLKRILICTQAKREWIGGVAAYTRNLEGALRREGLDVNVAEGGILPFNGKSRLRLYLDHLLDVYTQGGAGSMMFMDAVRCQYNTFAAEVETHDIIHVQDPFLGLEVRRHHPDCVVVLTIHGLNSEHFVEHLYTLSWRQRLVKKMLGYVFLAFQRIRKYEKEGFLAADQMISVDSNYASKAASRGVDLNRITIIPNAVTVDTLIDLSKRALIYKFDKAYFLMLRRLAPKNGVQFGVRAFLDWVDHKDVQLVLAGDGEMRSLIESVCKAHPQGNKVILLDTVKPTDIPPLIKHSIATMVPSIPVAGVTEATSLAVLESLALGVPVIASDIGGLTEINGGQGVINLVPAGSTKAIADQLEKVYQQYLSGTIDNWSKQEHVRKHFDTSSWVKKIIGVYEKAIITRCLNHEKL